jgi:hypothetical protein
MEVEDGQFFLFRSQLLVIPNFLYSGKYGYQCFALNINVVPIYARDLICIVIEI